MRRAGLLLVSLKSSFFVLCPDKMNPVVAQLLELLKYTIPAVVVLIASYSIINKFLVTELKRKQTALIRESIQVALPLRLQAYERLTLFVERIAPRQLIPRVYVATMNVAALRQALHESISAEFEHNLSQQIYVSRQVWETVKNVREQELAMIHQIAENLKPDAPARDLHARILDYVNNADGDLPVDIAREVIANEAKMVLSQSA